MKNIVVATNAARPDLSEEAIIRLTLVTPVSPREHITPARGYWFCDTVRYGQPVLGHRNQSGTYYVRDHVPPNYQQTDWQQTDWQLRKESEWVYPGLPRFPVAFFFDAQGPGDNKLPFLTLFDFNIFLARDDDWSGTGQFAFTFARYTDDYTVRWRHG